MDASQKPVAIRPAAVAGSFYPAEAERLHAVLSGMLEMASRELDGHPLPKALVVPHAGYVYSGQVAAHAYARLLKFQTTIHRVLLLGPAHTMVLQGMALPSVQAMETPLGLVHVDDALRARASVLAGVVVDDRPHRLEHSLEVQLPFLQLTLPAFTVLPVVVGDATAEDVASLLDACWGGRETLIVISSDLSHFLSWEQARQRDSLAAAHVLELAPVLTHDQACGATPLNGFLLAARKHGLVPSQLDLRNSGDVCGSMGRVVGYGAFCFVEAGA